MKWSWKLGTVAGIGLYVHGTFLLLLGWVGLSHWIEGGSAAAALAGVGFVVALFACVVLHELGHALTAQRFGIRTRDITLLPIGGVARLERMPDDPRQAMALLFGFVGLFANPFLLFIAFFVWIGAAQEASMVQMRSALGGIPVSRAMLTDFETLAPGDPGRRVLDLIIAGSQSDFPVVEDGRVVGVLLRRDVLNALAQHGQDWRVGDVMRRDFEVVEAGEMLETAFARL